MGVAGGGVGQSPVQQPQGGVLGPAAQTAQNATLVQLNDHAALKPAADDVRVPLHGIVPLRVGGHRNEAPAADGVEALLHKLRRLVEIELRQQIPPAAQGLEPLPVQQPVQLRGAEHLGSRMDGQGDALPGQRLPQAGQGRVQLRGPVVPRAVPGKIAVGRGDDVRDAGIRRHAGHLQRALHRGGAVVHPRQNVTVYIHHRASLPP